MQSLHFWLHCVALWHISSLLFNKPEQVFTFSTLGTYPEQGLEYSQSRTTHFQPESGWGTYRASPQPGPELCPGGSWNPFRNMARLEKKAPGLYSMWDTSGFWHCTCIYMEEPSTEHMDWEHCCHTCRENEDPDFTVFPFSRTVSRDRRTSGLLNEVAGLESGFSNTNSPLNKTKIRKKNGERKERLQLKPLLCHQEVF